MGTFPNHLPARLPQWGRYRTGIGTQAYEAWANDFIYRIYREGKGWKAIYKNRFRRTEWEWESVDNETIHPSGVGAVQAAQQHLKKLLQSLSRGSLSGSAMPTKKAKKATAKKGASKKSAAKKSAPKSAPKSASANKKAATGRVTAISAAAQKLYYATGNKRTWPACIKAASTQLKAAGKL